jgi:UDP-N-acetylmuramoyl-tripeptide--D-alanyl-D-alanine ligase
VTAASAVALALAVLAAGPAALRWLRVAQREHYLAGAASRFALRWWTSRPLDIVAALLGAAGALASTVVAPAAFAAALVGLVGPVGLSVRGRTARLSWTRRLRTLAAVVVVLAAAAIAIGIAAAGLDGATAAAAFVVAAMPLLVDAALAVTAPLEERLAARFVTEASRRLQSLHPRVVAITGSYGKTSTKGYVAHLLGGHYAVVASPRSFNNRAGLARTVNEQLLPGTDVLVAEMGTFAAGEIAEMCAWMAPEVAVITAVGPVHLERFGSLEAILAAKSEITVQAEVSVLNVDDERLAVLAGELASAGRRVVACSGRDVSADVAVLVEDGDLVLHVRGRLIGTASRAPGAAPLVAGNVACAVGAALAIGLDPAEALRRLAGLPGAPSRLAVETSQSGLTVLDDTYNSNPAGARLALDVLGQRGSRRRVVVTPGMVELGRLQAAENARFAAEALSTADVLVVVGRTNRRALLAGATAASGRSRVICVQGRQAAVDWVRRELGAGDAVLYENDLPDHYP